MLDQILKNLHKLIIVKKNCRNCYVRLNKSSINCRKCKSKNLRLKKN